jgi:hypothetical protein
LLASGHYEWQEVGRYWGEIDVAPAAPALETPVGVAAVPHTQMTSLLALVYGLIDKVWPVIFELAWPP